MDVEGPTYVLPMRRWANWRVVFYSSMAFGLALSLYWNPFPKGSAVGAVLAFVEVFGFAFALPYTVFRLCPNLAYSPPGS